jgi:hypothetical protein
MPYTYATAVHFLLDGANMYYVILRKRETTAKKVLFQIRLPVLKNH